MLESTVVYYSDHIHNLSMDFYAAIKFVKFKTFDYKIRKYLIKNNMKFVLRQIKSIICVIRNTAVRYIIELYL